MKFRLLSNDKYLKKNKDNIAFIFYGNINKDEINSIFKGIVDRLYMGEWIDYSIISFKNKIKIFVSNENIYNIEEIGENNKFFYIMKNQISIPYKNTKPYIIWSRYHDKILGYSCIEKEIEENIMFKPYIDGLDDKNHLLDENYYVYIEEIFAREEYKRSLNPLYTLSGLYKNSDKILSTCEGYNISIIKNNTLDNDIIKCINDYFKTNIEYKDVKKMDVDNAFDALLNCYGLWRNFIDDNLKINLQNYSNKIEERIGEFKSYYEINEYEGLEQGISLRIVCFIYEKAIVVISLETFE